MDHKLDFLFKKMVLKKEHKGCKPKEKEGSLPIDTLSSFTQARDRIEIKKRIQRIGDKNEKDIWQHSHPFGRFF